MIHTTASSTLMIVRWTARWPWKAPAGAPAMNIANGARTPATTDRQAMPPPVLALAPTLAKRTTRYASPAKETEANRNMLLIGTDSSAGWFTLVLSVFQAHPRSWGPS